MHATLTVSLFPSRDIVTFAPPFGWVRKLLLLTQRERVSLHSVFRSTQEAPSCVSGNHPCKLNFGFPHETSDDKHFTSGSKMLSVCSSQYSSCWFQCTLSQLFPPHVLRHHMGASSCVKQPGGLNVLLYFQLVCNTF